MNSPQEIQGNVIVALDKVDLRPKPVIAEAAGEETPAPLNVKDFMRATLDESITNVQYKLNSVLARHGMNGVYDMVKELEAE